MAQINIIMLKKTLLKSQNCKSLYQIVKSHYSDTNHLLGFIKNKELEKSIPKLFSLIDKLENLELKQVLTDKEVNDIEYYKKQFVNDSPPHMKDAFLSNIRLYEQAVDDVSHKYYLTETENSGFLTKRGTEYFVSRNDEINSFNFLKTHDGKMVSSTGINSYDLPWSNEADFQLYHNCKIGALKGAINVLSTSGACRQGRSQRVVGAAIDTLIKKYGFSREEFLITTEIGHLGNDDVERTPFQLVIEDLIKRNELTSSDVISESQYCIHPASLKHTINKSLSVMKLSTLDVVLLNDPIDILSVTQDKKEIEYTLSRAFEFLEEMVVTNKIRGYGITISPFEKLKHYRGFTLSGIQNMKTNEFQQFKTPDLSPTMRLHEVLKIAKSVGGEHHGFRYVSQKYSNLEMDPLFRRNQRKTKFGQTDDFYKIPLINKQPRGTRNISVLEF